MKRSRKSNRVTWASGVNLCQVRLFLTEDCPSKVGAQAQDNLQKKTSRTLHHSNANEFNDLPPGFEGIRCLNTLKEESSLIPRIAWKCPPKLIMSYDWQVTAGEESQEAKAQKLREMRVLEAVFPRPSAIPPSPSISLDIEEEYYDDSFTPIIPLIPIEEEATADLCDLSAPLNTLSNSQDPLPPNLAECNTRALEQPTSEKPKLVISTDMGADLVAAASAAVTAVMKSMEKGSQIDTDLLVKILSDPKMIEKLINNNQPPTKTTSSPMLISKPVARLIPHSYPNPVDGNLNHPSKPGLKSSPMPSGSLQPTVTVMSAQSNTDPKSELKQVLPPISLPGSESVSVSITRPVVSSSYAPLNQAQSKVNTMSMPAQPVMAPKTIKDTKPIASSMMTVQSSGGMKTNPVKNVNYIKNLIREHGSGKQEMIDRNISNIGFHYNTIQNMEFAQNVKQREVKSKFQKPCIYYRSSKGCRSGSSCPFKHDLSYQFQTGGSMVAPPAKRVKLSGETIGITRVGLL